MAKLAENRYGKSRVRVMRLKRGSDTHEMCACSAQVLLEGDFASCFTEGDNSKILPTDTMKNTVYSLARNSSAACVEDFGKELIAFLLQRNPQVSSAEASIAETPWDHVVVASAPHPTTFVQSSREIQTSTVAQ